MDGTVIDSEDVARRAVRAVRRVVGNGPVPLHKPFITAGDIEFTKRVMTVDPVGYEAIKLFEEELANTCSRRFAIAVSSGTAALHLALIALGIKSEKVVEMPSLTFAAAAAAVRYCQGKIHFGPGAFDLPAARIGVHLLGEIDPVLVGGEFLNVVPTIEDAAEALGSRWHGKPAGSFGDISILSFNNNKIVTTGGGGAVLTDDPAWAEYIRHLATTAKKPSPWFFEHDAIGFNYRMSNAAAALGLGQLLRLPSILARKREIVDAYSESFKREGFVAGDPDLEGSRPNHWLNTCTVPDLETRDAVLHALHANGIACRALFTPLHLQEPYEEWPIHPAEAQRAQDKFATTICLPSGNLPEFN